MRVRAGFAEVVSVCQQAIWEKDKWNEVLAILASYLNNDAITLERFGSDYDTLVDFHSHGIDAPAVATYMAYFHSRNPRHQSIKNSITGETNYDQKILSEQQIRYDEFYQDLLRPLGLKYFVSNTLIKSTDQLVLLAQHMPSDGDHATKFQVKKLEQVAPFIAQSYSLSLSVETLKERTSTAEEIIERLDVGMIIVGRDGKVQYCNSQASRLLSLNANVEYNRRSIRIVDRELNDQLKKALHSVIHGEVALPTPPILLLDRKSLSYLKVDVFPVHADSELGGDLNVTTEKRNAAIIVRDLNASNPLPDDMLRLCYSLTGKEIQIAKSLLAGLTLSEHAERHRVKITTVRTQCASLRAKLGARTQADVVRLLLPLQSK